MKVFTKHWLCMTGFKITYAESLDGRTVFPEWQNRVRRFLQGVNWMSARTEWEKEDLSREEVRRLIHSLRDEWPEGGGVNSLEMFPSFTNILISPQQNIVRFTYDDMPITLTPDGLIARSNDFYLSPPVAYLMAQMLRLAPGESLMRIQIHEDGSVYERALLLRAIQHIGIDAVGGEALSSYLCCLSQKECDKAKNAWEQMVADPRVQMAEGAGLPVAEETVGTNTPALLAAPAPRPW